jgi:uncharacterized membrane protein HdeD (DUF308 family)
MEVITGLRYLARMDGAWILSLSGLVSILVGIILLLRSHAGAFAQVWIIGVYGVIAGVLLGIFGLKAKDPTPQ